MSHPQLTEERLRTWLLAQADRERMCLEVLAMNPHYSDLKPRRPKGGPDGARDIEARYDGNQIWGAVGFRNSVSDSPEDRRWVKKKFADDLQLARDENPALWGFVFLTNIDLTPSEIDALRTHAQHAGVAFVDVYQRERLRLALDGVTGLALRFQYLQIPMSEAEQASFFATWGNKFSQRVEERLSATDKMLRRLEFLYDSDKPIEGVRLEVTLNGEYTPNDLGQFRFLALVGDTEVPATRSLLPTGPYHPSPRASICVADHDTEASGHMRGIAGYVWTGEFSPIIAQHILFSREKRLLAFRTLGRDEVSFRSIRDLDGCYLSVAMSNDLFEKLEAITLLVNGYAVAHLPRRSLGAFPDVVQNFPWPEPLQERSAPWSALLVNAASIGIDRDPDTYTYWQLNFGDTPSKLGGGRGSWVQIMKPPLR